MLERLPEPSVARQHACQPPSRDGIPRLWQSFQSVAPAAIEPAPTRVSNRELCRVELRSHADATGYVTGRGRTCDASRFRRALYRLSYGHAKAPGQGVEPRSPRSERGVLPVRRSRNVARIWGAAPLRPSPDRGRSTQQAGASRRARSRPLSRPPEAERCFLCHSPTLRPWITDHWLRTCAVVAVLRGGALEPEPHTLLLENRRQKQALIASVYFQRATLRVFLSQAGPRFDLELVQAEHHLWFRR